MSVKRCTGKEMKKQGKKEKGRNRKKLLNSIFEMIRIVFGDYFCES